MRRARVNRNREPRSPESYRAKQRNPANLFDSRRRRRLSPAP
jgi:hypothetical protein